MSTKTTMFVEMRRVRLHKAMLALVKAEETRDPMFRAITIKVGEWNDEIANAYDSGCWIHECDEHDIPVRAYLKPLWQL